MNEENTTPDAHAPTPPPAAALPGAEEQPAAPPPTDQPVAEQPAEPVAEQQQEPPPLPPVGPDGAALATEEPPAADSPPVATGGLEPPKPAAKKPRGKKAAEPAEEPAPSTAAEEAPADGAPAAEPAPESKKKWYVVKVTSGREESIKSAIERKVKIEGLEEFFGQIAIPVEEFVEKKKVRVTDKKTGEKVTQEKNVVKSRKKYPGYIFAEVEFNDRILYLFRETSGVGDFVGATHHRAPTPMTDREVTAMLTGIVDQKDRSKQRKQVVKLDFEKGDKVRIRDGPFANMEGEVKAITEPKDAGETPKVTVEVSIFGRPVPVELDYWHVDKV
jgi:transcriptional antiterminator NusG